MQIVSRERTVWFAYLLNFDSTVVGVSVERARGQVGKTREKIRKGN